MGLQYIGSKSRVVESLASHVGAYPGTGRFVDAFCGMGSVALMAAQQGWPVVLNDHLTCATVMSAARLTARPSVPFLALSGYEAVLDRLNALEGQAGFVWREYSPASRDHTPDRTERRYFTQTNAARLDSCRAQVAAWSRAGQLTVPEERLLIADLMAAANRVANVAGTYGCFLSSWTPSSQQPLTLKPRDLLAQASPVEVSVGDVKNVAVNPDDTVYLDPPYTKRQYAAYYHLLETIALGDEPVVTGVTGLRTWRHLASEFCYKRKALEALVGLIGSLRARRIVLSYSNEGHVDLGALTERLAGMGRVEIRPLAAIGRYRPNRQASAKGATVLEQVVVIEPHLGAVAPDAPAVPGTRPP